MSTKPREWTQRAGASPATSRQEVLRRFTMKRQRDPGGRSVAAVRLHPRFRIIVGKGLRQCLCGVHEAGESETRRDTYECVAIRRVSGRIQRTYRVGRQPRAAAHCRDDAPTAIHLTTTGARRMGPGRSSLEDEISLALVSVGDREENVPVPLEKLGRLRALESART
jgi:hypothetical protein